MQPEVSGYGDMYPTDESSSRVTLQAFIEQALQAQRLAVETALGVQTRALETAFSAHRREHDAAQLALEKAERALSVRLEGMNELRQQISTERGQYVNRKDHDTQLDGLRNDISALQNWRAGIDGRLAMVAAAGPIVALLFSLGLKLLPDGPH